MDDFNSLSVPSDMYALVPPNSPICPSIQFDEVKQSLEPSIVSALQEVLCPTDSTFKEVWQYDQLLSDYQRKLISIELFQPLPAPASETSLQINTSRIHKNELAAVRADPCDPPPRLTDERSFARLHLPKLIFPTLLSTDISPEVVFTRIESPDFDPTFFMDEADDANSPPLSPPLTDDAIRSDSPPSETLYQRYRNPTFNTTHYPYAPRTPILPSRKNTRTNSDKSSPLRPNKNSNSYRAWPAYRQAIADRDQNAASKLKEIQDEHEKERKVDNEQISYLTQRLNRAITHFQVSSNFLSRSDQLTVYQTNLDERAQQLDERAERIEGRTTCLHDKQNMDNWRDHVMLDAHGTNPDQAERLSRVFVQLTEILRHECNLSSPFFAFQLHRRMAKPLFKLMTALATPDNSSNMVVATDSAIRYYKLFVRELQELLYDDERSQFESTYAPFETDNVPQNPRPLPPYDPLDDNFSDDSSSEHGEW
jgi:hypothetical protein